MENIHKTLQYIVKFWCTSTLLDTELHLVTTVTQELNNTIQRYSTKPTQGCIYCVVGQRGAEYRLKIGYSTFGVTNGTNRNIFDRLKNHGTNKFEKMFPLLIAPIHNETIERNFHQLMKEHQKPLVVCKNGVRKRCKEMYAIDIDIIEKLQSYLEALSNDTNFNSDLQKFILP